MKKKIAIVGLFRQFDPGYALAVGWVERAKMLAYMNEDFDFFVQDNCESDEFPHAKRLVPRMTDGMTFEARVDGYTKFFLDNLQDYDCILTSDLIYQKKGHFLPMNQAMRNAEPHLKAHWYHWIHSGWNMHRELPYPESLRFTMMPKSTIVYMNTSEMQGIANQFKTSIDNVACVYNPKDFRSFNDFHPVSWDISKDLKLWTKDFIQILPLCTTRMDAKGINDTIFAFSRLKAAGFNVALIIANSHINTLFKKFGEGKGNPYQMKKDRMTNSGLVEYEDFVWTSEYFNGEPAPRKVVSDLMKLSNVFVFGSWREVCPNVLLEAKISGCQLVVNEATPPLREFGGLDAIRYISDSKTPGVADGERGDFMKVNYNAGPKAYFDNAIVAPLKERYERISKKYQWEFSYERIWHEQMKPLLYGKEA